MKRAMLWTFYIITALSYSGHLKSAADGVAGEVLVEFLHNNPTYRKFSTILADVAGHPAEFGALLLQLPEYALNGGITYAMTFDEMRDAVKNKLQALKAAGKIITPDQFALIKKEYYIDERRGYHGYATRDLKRIWGADYINNYQKYLNNFIHSFVQPWKAPDYVIVVDDPNRITVTLDFEPEKVKPGARKRNVLFDRPFDADRPYIDTVQGTIYFKKIEGEKIATNYIDDEWIRADKNERFSEEHLQKYNLGYIDFSSDPGNIIRSDSDRQAYIVDTEIDSFNLAYTFKGRKMTLDKLLAIEGLLKAMFLQKYKDLPIGKDGTISITLDLSS